MELIAHEFIFNSYYHTCSWKKIVFVLSSFALGAGIMALLGESRVYIREFGLSVMAGKWA